MQNSTSLYRKSIVLLVVHVALINLPLMSAYWFFSYSYGLWIQFGLVFISLALSIVVKRWFDLHYFDKPYRRLSLQNNLVYCAVLVFVVALIAAIIQQMDQSVFCDEEKVTMRDGRVVTNPETYCSTQNLLLVFLGTVAIRVLGFVHLILLAVASSRLWRS